MLDGGGDSNGLLAYFSTDFRGLDGTPTLASMSIDRVFINTNAKSGASAFDTFAIFAGGQLHNQPIAINSYTDPNPALAGDANKFAALSIYANGADNDFSKLDFADSSTTDGVNAFDISTGDFINIIGGAGADSVTGTTDYFYGFSAGDMMNGGGGSDGFIFRAGDEVTGVTINGDAGTNNINAWVSTDFSTLNGGAALTANDLEAVIITHKGASAVSASLSGAQLTGQAIAINTAKNPP